MATRILILLKGLGSLAGSYLAGRFIFDGHPPHRGFDDWVLYYPPLFMAAVILLWQPRTWWGSPTRSALRALAFIAPPLRSTISLSWLATKPFGEVVYSSWGRFLSVWGCWDSCSPHPPFCFLAHPFSGQ